MSHEPSDPKLEDLVRECMLERENRGGELNALLRESEEARPIAARVLIEEAALISALRLANVKKWAQTLQPRTIEEIAGPTAPRRGHRMAIALAAAACLGISALILFNLPAKGPQPQATVDAVNEKTIGTIQQVDPSNRISSESALLENNEFKIGSGRARIELDNGVVLSVAGPTRLLIGFPGCRLWQGQLGVEVPEGLDHFVVQTDDSRFVDMGTVFTVSAQPGKRSEMAVVKGLVRAEHISPEGDVLAKQLVRNGEGVIIENTTPGIKSVKAAELGHESPIKLAEQPLAVPQAYRDAVSAARPAIAWNFEQQLDPTTFGNSAGHGFAAKIKGKVSVRQASKGNRYLILGADGNQGWLESPDQWRKQDNAPFTVEMWARPNLTHTGSLLSLLVVDAHDPFSGSKSVTSLSHFLMEFTHNRAFAQPTAGPSLRCAFRSPATHHPTKTTPDGLNASLFSPQRYKPGTWYHVVARVDQDGCTLFLNGQAVDQRTARLPHFGEVNLLLRVGALQSGENNRQFTGAIDEVAIYPRALSNGEIMDHFSKVREANYWRTR